jgi:predicted dehydrogenase
LIKIGIVGLGRLGRIHLQQLSTLDVFRISGLYDINRELASTTANEEELAYFEDYGELLDHCGAVLIATPTSSHFAYAEKAIRKGRHVFIEKPIASEPSEARKLTDLAEEAGVIIQVGHVERFNPAFCAVKDRELNPRFIESHRLAGFDIRGTDVSVILDLMIHDIDIVLSLVHANVKRIRASGVAVVTDNIDIANARLEFDNGAVANLTASRISFKKMRKMRLFQHNEYIGIDFLEKKVDLFRLSHGAEDGGIPFMEDDDEKRIHLEQLKVVETNAIREELRAFAHSVRTRKTPEVSAEQATRALELASQILYQIRKNNHLAG